MTQGAETPAPTSTPTLRSQEVLAGLGAAPRELLATCLALFEDGTLQQRLSERFDALKQKMSGEPPKPTEAAGTLSSLQERAQWWQQQAQTDDALRVLLWMRLREAFVLPAKTFGSLRSTRTAADDLVAAVLASTQPGLLGKSMRRLGWKETPAMHDTLDALARETLGEMISEALNGDITSDPAVCDALLDNIKRQVAQLDDDSRERLLAAIGARELNDDAIRTLLLTGGGLSTFGTAVSLGGFSSYILAAKASAFIPLVSGPGLVSFVAVLSNPITIVLATVGTGLLATRSANRQIQKAIALRVVALLALNGLNGADAGLRSMAQAFAKLPDINETGMLEREVLHSYQVDWKSISAAHRHANALPPTLANAMDSPLARTQRSDRWQHLLHKDDGVLQDMAATTAMTVGELLYNIHALDPSVLEAADFSRVADLSDPLAFAVFAHEIEAMSEASQLGAISNLKGYVAERVVASQLIDQGHVVSFPEHANQAGWDLQVDGIPFQIKNAGDLNVLAHHFEHYDYPVLANAEVAGMLTHAAERGNLPAWADHVHFVEGYSQQGVQVTMEHSMDAGDGMLHPHVPTFSILLNSARNFNRFLQGQITGSQAVQDVIINGTVRAGLAVAGNYVGVGVGLLVFGPAGAVVLGSALPILSRMQSEPTINWIERITRGKSYQLWEKEAREALDVLLSALRTRLKEKAALLKSQAWSAANPAAEYLAWRHDDDVRFLREAWQRLKAIEDDKQQSVEKAGERVLVWLSTSTLHPATYQAELQRWLKIFEPRPDIVQNARDVAAYVANEIGDARDRFKTALKNWKNR